MENLIKIKEKSFRNTAIVAGVVLYILKLIAKSISSKVEDPVHIANYFVYVMIIYFVIVIFLIILLIKSKKTIKSDPTYGWIGVAFLILFSIQLLQTYKIIPAAIQYNSYFNGKTVQILDDREHPSDVATNMSNAILSNIDLWGIFAIGQFVVYVISDDFILKTSTNNDLANKQIKTKFYIHVNDMDIEIKDKITFGSSGENNVFLDSNFVSGNHGVIGKEDEHIYVQDLKSTNGTFVNGNKLVSLENYLLKTSDIVTFGNIDVQIIEK